MMRSGFSGFYLAVDRTGTLAAGQSFTLTPGPRAMPLMTTYRQRGQSR